MSGSKSVDRTCKYQKDHLKGRMGVAKKNQELIGNKDVVFIDPARYLKITVQVISFF